MTPASLRLVDVYHNEGIWPVRFRNVYYETLKDLYALLGERTPEQSISHHVMPTFDWHIQFVRSEPYTAWYLIESFGEVVGATYLSKADEIGIAIFRKHQHRGLASAAIRKLMAAHPRERYLANIAPTNDASHGLFTGLGFRLIQHTYALDGEHELQTR